MADFKQSVIEKSRNSNVKSVLFFSPFGRILPHSIPEATIARELSLSGFEVTHITCGELLKGQCIVLDAHGLNHSKLSRETLDRTCRECNACAANLFKNVATLTGMFDSRTKQIAQSEIERLVATISPQSFAGFEYEGFPFGKIAGYQHLIHFKKFTPDISPSEWPVFLKELEHCLWVYFALNAFVSQTEKLPDVGLVYNSLYGVNAVFRHFFEKKGVRIISLHAGANLHHFHDTMLLMEKSTFTHLTNLRNIWPEFENRPLTQDRADWVLDHFKELAAGKSVFAYSAPAQKDEAPDIRKKWNITNDKKICLVAMSSYDERFAAEYTGNLAPSRDSIFSDQIDWIKSIKDYATSHEHIHFIIRLHPREFPNKRESVRSRHAELVIEALKGPPENLTINTPADNLSLYDIARDVDLALTSWSSVGKELMLLGIPLVLYTADSQWFPAQLGKVAASKSQYFEFIEESLKEGWSIERSYEVFRWLAFETIDNTVTLTTRLSPARSFYAINFFWRVINKLFGPASGIKYRTGRVRERDVLCNIMANGGIPAILLRDQNKSVATTSSEQEIVRTTLIKVGLIFFGPEGNWPLKFRQMLVNARS